MGIPNTIAEESLKANLSKLTSAFYGLMEGFFKETSDDDTPENESEGENTAENENK